MLFLLFIFVFFFFKQKTAYEMRISDWSSDVCSSDLRHGRPASYIQAGTYSAVAHYLKAIDAAGTDEAKAVSAKMKEMPVNDFMTDNATVRADGRVVRDMYLVEVKKPSESTGPWDYYKVLATIPGDEAYRPMAEGNCPFGEG